MTAGPQDPSAYSGRRRVISGMVWTMLLLGLLLWGRAATDGGVSVFGEEPAAGRQVSEDTPLPPAHEPLEGVRGPVRLDIAALDVHARIVDTGLTPRGGVAAPPYSRAEMVGWYRDGPKPGEPGAALLVGHVDTDKREAVFYPLSTIDRGTRVKVTGADGTVMEFTVESTEVVWRDSFDAERVYGQREPGRAELRLLTCGGRYDRDERTYTANVVVSAYLTGTHESA